jgi:hypothetical protein
MTQKDIKLLWGRAGNRCSMCRYELSHETPSSHKYLLGEQAHIIGESESAPRGESPLSREQRNSYHNLILLCPNHHTEIDKNVNEWPVEKLHQAKSQHELWVSETLSSQSDVTAQAHQIIASSIIDKIVTACRLDEWEGWTSFALSPEQQWTNGMNHELYQLVKDTQKTLWPDELDELKRACLTLSQAAYRASETFWSNAELHDGIWYSIRFYKEPPNNPNYQSDLAEFERWQDECYQWVRDATKAANWFADMVRRDVNPLFFAEHSKLSIEEGPFADFKYRCRIPEFTEAEKLAMPNALISLSDQSNHTVQ